MSPPLRSRSILTAHRCRSSKRHHLRVLCLDLRAHLHRGAPPPRAPTASPPTRRLPRLAAGLCLLLQRHSAPPVWAIFVALVDRATAVAESNLTRKYFATAVMDLQQRFTSEFVAGISRDAPDPSSISRASKKVDKNTLHFQFLMSNTIVQLYFSVQVTTILYYPYA
ncbi:uncharacterized protein LOC100383705 [Zea mays]|uniref:Uncharacterized protein n=1 Tax=Zea mays TaxID=4577 RepID=C0PIF9_MAIZE|nr:uncharacterized protein LOC100383705 [Zea mays]ACN34975.1 unknown [Zea mays]|eukprot:NP_001169813.1 uncharacterized protein LOC100383705 [Zea mays]